jgi:hypothetical protein
VAKIKSSPDKVMEAVLCGSKLDSLSHTNKNNCSRNFSIALYKYQNFFCACKGANRERKGKKKKKKKKTRKKGGI